MSVRALTGPMLDRIFEDDIVPIIFPQAPSGLPMLVIVTGVRGAGSARGTAQVAASAQGDLPVLSNEQLQGFHPDFLDVTTASDANVVREAAVAWSAAAMKRARQERHSLLIEGEALTAPAVLGTAALFARDGYRTRTVIVAGIRAQTLLATVSNYERELRDVRSGTAAQLAGDDGDHDNVRAIVEDAVQTMAIDRLSVLDHRGVTVFDRSREDRLNPYGDALQEVHAAENAQLTPLESVEWMSELRRITEFEMSSMRSHPMLIDSLIELHEIALNKVIPQLSVPRGSAMVSRQELEYASRLVRLREMRSERAPSTDIATPVATPAPVDRDGIGR